MDEKDIRFRIAAARRMLFREGCDSQTAGHVSARAEQETDALWITPFQYFDETLPGDVARIGFDLSVREGSMEVSPAVKFHAAIYEARPDVHAVIHHHGYYVSLTSTTDRIIGQYNIAASLFFEEQALFEDDNENPNLEGDRIVAALGSGNSLLMKNHGCIVVGDGLENATVCAIMYEKCARFHIDAMAIGGRELPRNESLMLKENFHRYFLPNMWAAQLRRLRRSDPDLFAALD